MIFVVEGKTDSAKLSNIFKGCRCVETNGSAVSQECLNLIVQLSKDNQVIIFTDPDGPGKTIRQKVMAVVPNAKHAFIEKSKAIKGKKVGIAQASAEDILIALENVIEFTDFKNSISWEQFNELGLNGRSDSKQKRIFVCNWLNIQEVNAKTLFKWLNMIGKTQVEINDKISSDWRP